MLYILTNYFNQATYSSSVVKHETRIREVSVQLPWPTNLVEVFNGFLNVKIAEELVILLRQMSGWSPFSTNLLMIHII